MKTLLKYNANNFTISQDEWDKNLTAKTESMMAMGNGYLGLRSVDEEVESYNKEDLLINGIFNNEADDEVTEIANLADSIQTPIFLDGVRFSLCEKDEYLKEINLMTGVLSRKIVAIRKDKTFEIKFERFVSQKNKNAYAQKISIKQIIGPDSEVIVHPRINGQTTNHGAQHFKEGIKTRVDMESVRYQEETTNSKRFLVHNMVLNIMNNKRKLVGGDDNFIITMDRRQVGFKITTTISPNKPLVIEKLLSVNTSIDDDNVLLNNEEVLSRSNQLYQHLRRTSFDKMLSENNLEWEKIRNSFDVKIGGNSEDADYDRLAFAWSIFHMNSFVPKNNSNLSIGAKGLSGEGYQGHSYWDTEFFINPNYLFTDPQVVRNLLTYRYKGIEGARVKAKEQKQRKEESKLNGAQFPWEMAWPTDGEVCPYWGQADIVTGEQVPIASRRQEIHVSADVAYAIHQYYDFTKDHDFMVKMGYEMIIDTAIFWSYRAEKQPNGTYMIKDIMGPNEYKGNVDNNAFTNAMAKKNIDLALDYISKLESSNDGMKILTNVYQRIPYEVPIEQMKNVSKNLVQQLPNEKGIIAENDQFLSLNRIDVSPFQLLGDAGKKLFNTKEGQKRLSSQLVKQADVVLLTYLFDQEYGKDVIKKNFDFYEPITTHDSSLSPTTYAIQAVDIRKTDLAYKLFKYSLGIDMGPNMKSCDKGIHAGSIAAIWQTIVFGFGGLRWTNGVLRFSPKLPDAWDSLSYSVVYRGIKIYVEIDRKSFVIWTNGDNLDVNINSKKTTLSKEKQSFEVKNEY